VGYTPDLVTAVWMGYPEGEIAMKPSCLGTVGACRVTRSITSGGVVGGSFPALIWHSFMMKALLGVPPHPFKKPNVRIITVTIDTRTGCLAGPFTPLTDQAPAGFQPGAQPTKTCPQKGDTAAIPDVTGLPVAEAMATLTNAGLHVSKHKQISHTHPAGRVLDQNPSAGTRIKPGASVTITVSVKPGSGGASAAQADVPNVLGLTRSAAQQALSPDFQSTSVTKKESGQWKHNKGLVWKQSPSGGSRAELDSTVTIWVNPG
jgi:membrane peptidoglycan carboxypeptidase